MADIKMFAAIPPSCLPRCGSLIIHIGGARNTTVYIRTQQRQMVPTYLRAGFRVCMHKSLLVASSQLLHLHAHYYTCSCIIMTVTLPAEPRFQISCILVVTIMLMLMHVGCGTIKCGSTTCRNYDSTCDGGRILDVM